MIRKPNFLKSGILARLPLGDLVFWTAYILLLAIHCVENTALTYTQPGWISGMYLLRNLLYLVLLLKAAFLSVYRPRELWAMVGILLSAGLCFLCSGDFTLLEFAIVVIAAKDVSAPKLITVFAMTKAVAVMLTLLLSDLQILPTLYYLHDGSPLDTLGFCHRNVLGANMAILCLCWCYLRYDRLDRKDVVLWVVLSFVTYFLAISRSSLIIMLMSIIVVYLFRVFEPKLRGIVHMRKIINGLFLLLFLLSFVCSVFYERNSPFWEFVDDLFTSRLQFANHCFEQFGLTPFGQEMPFVGTMDAILTDETRLILDNAYMRVLIHDGLIPGLLFLTLFLICLDRSWRKGNGALVACLLVMAVYGISETYMLDVFYCFPMLLGCHAFFRKPSDQEARKPFQYAREILRPICKWIYERSRPVCQRLWERVRKSPEAKE